MYQKDYYHKNKEKITQRRRELANTPEGKRKKKSWQLKQRYGITLEEYEKLFAEQEGKCAICGKLGSKFVIDHNHETGKVRGLLCYACNNGIGNLGDDILLLQRAIEYINR